MVPRQRPPPASRRGLSRIAGPSRLQTHNQRQGTPMQTRWLTMMILAGATGTLSAQLPRTPFVGLFVGGTEAQVSGSVSDISNRTGAAFGAYGVIPIDRTWSAEP